MSHLNSSAITSSMPQNYLGLFNKKGEIKIDKIIGFMGVSRKELASAFGLTAEQLRPTRLGAGTKGKLNELASVLEGVATAFEGDVEKTRFWLNIPNYNFGGTSPKSLILRGRYKKLAQFVYSSR